MNFDLIAKDLLSPKTQLDKGEALGRANALVELADAGFGRSEIFSELRSLYDDAEDGVLKKQILDLVMKVHGLYKDEERRDIPSIIFNITADPKRMQDMLAPPYIKQNRELNLPVPVGLAQNINERLIEFDNTEGLNG